MSAPAKAKSQAITLCKVIWADGRCYHGGRGSWPLPAPGGAGKWMRVDGDLKSCVWGLHLCRPPDLVFWLGPAIFLAQHEGDLLEARNKIVVRKARLLSRVETWTPHVAARFAAECAGRAADHADADAGFANDADEAAAEAADAAADAADAAAAYEAAYAADDADEAAAVVSAAVVSAARFAADAAEAAAEAADAAAEAAAEAADAAAMFAAEAAEREWQTARLFELLDIPVGD